jgi:hypothetical protein
MSAISYKDPKMMSHGLGGGGGKGHLGLLYKTSAKIISPQAKIYRVCLTSVDFNFSIFLQHG